MTVPDAPQPPRRHKDGWAQTPGDAWQRSGRAPRDAPGPRRDDVVRTGTADRALAAAADPTGSAPAPAWRPEEEWLPDPRPAPERAWTPEHEWSRFTGALAASDEPRTRGGRRALTAAWVAAATVLLVAAGVVALLH